MEEKEITIAYGNEIQLTTSGKKNKQVFLKFSPAFRNKQLKELKGAPLSVFLCYALHSDENGYTWIDTKYIQKETGFNRIDLARKVLIEKKYLYTARLFNKDGLLRDYIYRIFQPVEYKEFMIRGEILTPARKKTCTAESAYQAQNEGIIEEEPIIIKEEPNNNMQLQATAGKVINSLIGKFKLVNPSYEKLFTNTTQRSALERLVNKYGAEKIERLIETLPQTNQIKYFPVICTPLELENKLGALLARLSQEKNEQNKNKILKI